ncbi:PREDICTED: uncharacterized protein LOC106748607 [Dinoponera quadriceps]|uniref:Odorant receptor n=1 Tax=Dinoponera quadriceps TaxID=609295 RepID=A0A6P3XW65_DINQU|nr:PREDICTED: uncharacterized protein LOC106748607 [Dinoponera quadriceps]
MTDWNIAENSEIRILEKYAGKCQKHSLIMFLIAVTVLEDFGLAIIRSGVLIGHFAAMFLCNFAVQTVTNHSAEMFTAAYHTEWYLAPLPIQKSLLFVMQHSLKANTLLFGGIYVASLEGFSTVTDFLMAVTVLKEFSEIFICAGVVFGHFTGLFIGNLVGQIVTDHSSEIFTATYNAPWHIAPLPIQKLLLFIMQHSLKAKALIIGEMFTASLEGFSTLAVFVTHDYTLNLLTEVLSFVFPTTLILLVYHVYNFSSDAAFKNRVELGILNDYASSAKLLTRISFSFLVVIVSVGLLLADIPVFLDIVLPQNESRRQETYITAEYFLDSSKYLPLFATHLAIFICLVAFTFMATGTTIYGYLLHACATFKIVNYRIQMMMNKDVLRIPSLERERVILERLVCAVDLHRRNLQFCDMIMLQLGRPSLVLIVISVSSLSFSMYRLLQALVEHGDIVNITLPFAFVAGHICITFLFNYVGQQLTNNNAEIFNTV